MKLNRITLPYIFDVPAYRIKRRLSIVIAQPWSELSEEARTTLQKLIQALSIPYHEVPILNRHNLKEEDIQVLETAFLICFGVSVDGKNEKYQLYQITDTNLVLADNPDVFCKDKNLKQKLWQVLQNKFK